MSQRPLELGEALWQFALSGVEIRPHLTAWGKMGEIEGKFWLKRWGERLLFCAASKPERVYAVTTPCPQTQLLAFWRAGIEDGRVGRLMMHPQFLTKAEETDSAFLSIHQSDGSRQTREWCGGEWFLRPKVSASRLPVWHFDWKPPRLSPVSDEILAALNEGPFPENERQDQAMIWLRGSRIEWKRALQSCATLFFASNNTDLYGHPVREGSS